jgi:hypothetical protein
MMRRRKVRKARESKKEKERRENAQKKMKKRGKAHQRRNKSTARTTENRKIKRPVLYWKPGRRRGGTSSIFQVMAISAHPA